MLLEPLEAKTGETPETGFPFASLRVIVMVALSVLSALTGVEDTAIKDCDALGAPAMKEMAMDLQEPVTGPTWAKADPQPFKVLKLAISAPVPPKA